MQRPALSLALAAALFPAAARADEPPPFVAAALAEALTLPQARLSVTSYSARLPAGCVPEAAVPARPIAASGRYAVKLTGPGCAVWAQIELRVRAPVLVTTRAVRAGEPLADAVTIAEREVTAGAAPVGSALGDGANAARALPRGALLERPDVRSPGLAAGQPIKVIALIGALAIEQSARTVACGGGRACAVLPSGKHVEGRLDNGRLIVEAP